MTVDIRPMRRSDIPDADRVVRIAFGTFLGMPEPEQCFAGQDYVRTRYAGTPEGAFVAVRDGAVVGSNFATCWGSVGFFGPLSVDPGCWDGGIAKRLMEPVLARFADAAVRCQGLFTFPHSVRHVGLYRRFGFWPRALTFVTGRAVPAPPPGPAPRLFGQLPPAAQQTALGDVAALADRLYEGFDPGAEVRAVQALTLGHTVLLDGPGGLEGFAVCHVGAGTEAGPGMLYVKVAAVAPGPGAARRFARLLDAVEWCAGHAGVEQVSAGVSAARTQACRILFARGYRVLLQGIAMHRHNVPGLARGRVYVLDDWR